MILLSVGTQLAFPRLVNAVDLWAERNRDVKVIGQIGPHTGSLPQHMEYFEFKEIADFEALQRQCSLMVSHAGVGSILKAAEFGKPIIVMPRRGDQNEHRNNHQIASARYFINLPNVWVAADEFELVKLLNARDQISFAADLPTQSLETMTANIRGEMDRHRRTSGWLKFIRAARL